MFQMKQLKLFLKGSDMKLKQGGQVIAMELETSIPQLKETQIMKSELKAKFLQHLLSKKQENEGFTLIELLVVIIIIGILAAIALPSFLNQANKARQSEAQTYVGSINRGQQAYYLEKDGFAGNVTTLGIGVPTQTAYYTYATAGAGTSATQATTTAVKRTGSVKEYSGIVWIDGSGTAATSLSNVCPETTSPTTGCTQ